MKRKKMDLLIVGIVMALLVMPICGAAGAVDSYQPVPPGQELRSMGPGPDQILNGPDGEDDIRVQAAVLTNGGSCILDTKYFPVYDGYYGGLFFDTFYLMANGTDAQVWVQADLSWPAGDPRPTPVISCDQAAYILSEFENTVIPIENTYFGPADIHDGTYSLLEAWGYVPSGYYDDAAGRAIILVSNIRDDNYYDPSTEEYIGGFYWLALEQYLDRNVITVDAFDWVNRTGPDCASPYATEAIIAREYEQLLHDDYDPFEERWVNEGLSQLAITLCGYGIPSSYVEAFSMMPENSLVIWQDQGNDEILADYGIAYLYQMYMYEKYGIEFITAEFLNTRQGIAGVDAALVVIGETDTFADSFHNFSVACYTGDGFSSVSPTPFQVDVGHPGIRNPEAYATPGAPPWGTDYYLIWGYNQIGNFRFNGEAFRPIRWTSDGDVLWGGADDLADNWAIFDATGGGSLTFDTNYSIEDHWDFGFVQVSTDGGSTWTSLANANTTNAYDPSALPAIIANMPGLTGDSGGWQTMSFDLSAYAGQDILIAFRYMTDWATLFDGWYIDNVYVDGTLVSDCSSTDAFMSLEEVLGLSEEYTVTFIGERIRKGVTEYEVVTVLSGDYQSDWVSIRDLFDHCRWAVMLVTYDAPEEEASYMEYTFDIEHAGGKDLLNL